VCANQGFGNVGVKGGRVQWFALVLVEAARFDALCLGMFAVKHQHMGFLVIHPNDGVKSGHRKLSGLSSVCWRFFFGFLAADATRRVRPSLQARDSHGLVACRTNAVGACGQAPQCVVDAGECQGFVLTQGQRDVVLSHGLGVRVLRGRKLLSGHFGAAVHAATLLSNAYQNLRAQGFERTLDAFHIGGVHRNSLVGSLMMCSIPWTHLMQINPSAINLIKPSGCR
jgi:hypothetical protein